MRTRRARCRRSLLAAPAAALVLLAGSALAQPAGGVGGAGQAAVDPLDLTGRTFGGLRLPLGPVAGVVEFAASHAWVWVEQDGGVTTQRLLLEDGVVVTLGSTRLEAKRAVVWIERLGGSRARRARTRCSCTSTAWARWRRTRGHRCGPAG